MIFIPQHWYHSVVSLDDENLNINWVWTHTELLMGLRPRQRFANGNTSPAWTRWETRTRRLGYVASWQEYVDTYGGAMRSGLDAGALQLRVRRRHRQPPAPGVRPGAGGWALSAQKPAAGARIERGGPKKRVRYFQKASRRAGTQPMTELARLLYAASVIGVPLIYILWHAHRQGRYPRFVGVAGAAGFLLLLPSPSLPLIRLLLFAVMAVGVDHLRHLQRPQPYLMFGSRRTPDAGAAPDCAPTISVLIPAKDEARVIAGCLDAIFRSAYPSDRLTLS